MERERQPAADDRTAARIIDAVRNVELTQTGAWSALDGLSSNTRVDLIETFQDEIRFDGRRFRGPVVFHVTLQYGGGEDEVTLSEAFPGRFEGHFKDDRPIIDDVDVDTSSFYKMNEA
jgi:hypothetical protein